MVNTMYMPYDPLCFYYEGRYYQYLKKDGFERAGKAGTTLFSDRVAYTLYVEDLKKVCNEIKDFCSRVSEPNILITQELLKDFLNLVMKLHVGYSKMGYEHTDKAYSSSSNNPQITESLKHVAVFKDEVRTIINNIFFETDSFLTLLLSRVAKHFSLTEEVLERYTQQELLDLFTGKIVTDTQVADRSIGFAAMTIDTNTTYYGGEAVKHILEELAEPISTLQTSLQGIVANKGKATGKVKVITVDFSDFSELKKEINSMEQGQILVVEMTAPELILACHKAAAIVTDLGGLMSHAAIISRELDIPCVVGTKVASQIFRDNDMIEVDATSGIVRKISS